MPQLSVTWPHLFRGTISEDSIHITSYNNISFYFKFTSFKNCSLPSVFQNQDLRTTDPLSIPWTWLWTVTLAPLAFTSGLTFWPRSRASPVLSSLSWGSVTRVMKTHKGQRVRMSSVLRLPQERGHSGHLHSVSHMAPQPKQVTESLAGDPYPCPSPSSAPGFDGPIAPTQTAPRPLHWSPCATQPCAPLPPHPRPGLGGQTPRSLLACSPASSLILSVLESYQRCLLHPHLLRLQAPRVSYVPTVTAHADPPRLASLPV